MSLKVIPYTKFQNFGIIRVFSYDADKKTDRLEYPTHSDWQSWRGYYLVTTCKI